MAGGRAWRLDTRILPGLAAAAAVAVLLAHAALLPLGAWYPDEFIQFAMHQRLGWAQVAERVFGWSPRPASELLLFGYSSLVAWLDRPGVTWVLAAGWAGTLAVLMVAGRLSGMRLAVPLALMAAALVVARPGEMWFWPAAALAYLPAIAGLAGAAILLAGPHRTGQANAALCLCLLLAAGSVELGAIAVLPLCLGQLLRHAVARWVPLAPQQPAWVWLPPLALALAVLAVLVLQRVGASFEVFVPNGTVGDTRRSIEASIRHLGRALGGVPAEPEAPGAMWLGIPLKLALIAGFWALLPPGQPSPRGSLTCLLGAAAVLAAAVASIVLAYRQFGTLCCERHDTFRQALLVVGGLLLAAALPRPAAPLARSAAMLALVGAFAAILSMRVAALRHDLALRAEAGVIRGANWACRPCPGRRHAFRSQPRGRLTSGWTLEPGVHRRGGAQRGAAAGHELACLRDPPLLRQDGVAERVRRT